MVLDELTQGLDPAARRDVWDAIRALRDGGTTVLLVTHYMDEAEALCDRVVVLRDGRVVDSGTPTQLVDRHAPWATVRFGWPAEVDAPDWAAIPGVEDVRCSDGTVQVHGDRRMVAHLCAELVRSGRVPADLAVLMPDLEAALVTLLTSGDPR